MNQRQVFLQHLAQTSPSPMGLEIVRAEGIYQYDRTGKRYIDLISGFSVCNIGHSHPEVIKAVHQQASDYMHVIVYGEFIQSPQVSYAKMLSEHLPEGLDTVYFTNSGSEAVEGAMKLSKRVTRKTNIISFNRSYHGSTQGSLSLIGDEYWRNAFRPLLPGVYHYDYNSKAALEAIDSSTACVVAETVQAEAGINKPDPGWMKALKEKCDKAGALLVLDEIQAGFGRTGSLWAFEQYGIVPDILLLGKALGGGMPLGAFIASRERMNLFTFDPVLGHISTFGGHPVSCAAGKAAFEVLVNGEYIARVKQFENIMKQLLQHSAIKALRTEGLWAAVEFESFELNHRIIQRCIDKGIIVDWFLFAPECMRIGPPLIITENELTEACNIILDSIREECEK